MLLWRRRLYNDNDFVLFRKLHTSVAPAIVWKMSHSGCDLKLCDFIARLWASTPDSGTYICSHCNCQYRDALTHLIAECGCSQNLRESFLHDCIDILPPELLNGLTASDADTFVAAVLSASCWSNLDTEVTEMFYVMHIPLSGTAVEELVFIREYVYTPSFEMQALARYS